MYSHLLFYKWNNKKKIWLSFHVYPGFQGLRTLLKTRVYMTNLTSSIEKIDDIKLMKKMIDLTLLMQICWIIGHKLSKWPGQNFFLCSSLRNIKIGKVHLASACNFWDDHVQSWGFMGYSELRFAKRVNFYCPQIFIFFSTWVTLMLH